MDITDKHNAVLRAAEKLSNGETAVINRGDAEECIDMELVEPFTGYPLTQKGKALLKEHR